MTQVRIPRGGIRAFGLRYGEGVIEAKNSATLRMLLEAGAEVLSEAESSGFGIHRPPVVAGESGLKSQTKKVLLELATSLGVEGVSQRDTKDDIVAAIEARQAEQDAAAAKAEDAPSEDELEAADILGLSLEEAAAMSEGELAERVASLEGEALARWEAFRDRDETEPEGAPNAFTSADARPTE